MGWSGLASIVCVLVAIPLPSVGKLCCDQDCRHPVSYGRTVMRHITRDEGFLSYPASAIVTVFGKAVLIDEQGEEFWEAEIQGKRGLIRNSALKELTFKCEPTFHIQEEESAEKILDDGAPGGGTVPTDHAPSDTPTPLEPQQDMKDESQQTNEQPFSTTPTHVPPTPENRGKEPPTVFNQQPPEPPISEESAPLPPVTNPDPSTNTWSPPDAHPLHDTQPSPETQHPPPTFHDSQGGGSDPQQVVAPTQGDEQQPGEEERLPEGDQHRGSEDSDPAAPTNAEQPNAEQAASFSTEQSTSTSEEKPPSTSGDQSPPTNEEQLPPTNAEEPGGPGADGQPSVMPSVTQEPVVPTPEVTPPTGHAPEHANTAQDPPQNIKIEYNPPEVNLDYRATSPEEPGRFEGNLNHETASTESAPQEPSTPEGQSVDPSQTHQDQSTQAGGSPLSEEGQSAQTGDSPQQQLVFSEKDDERYWDSVDDEEWEEEDEEEDEFEEDEDYDWEDPDKPSDGEPFSAMPTPVPPTLENIGEQPPEPPIPEESAPLPPFTHPLKTDPSSTADFDPLAENKSDPSTVSDSTSTVESMQDLNQGVEKTDTDESKTYPRDTNDSETNVDRGSVEETTLPPRESEEEVRRREHAQKMEEMRQLYEKQREARRQEELARQQLQHQENDRKEEEKAPHSFDQQPPEPPIPEESAPLPPFTRPSETDHTETLSEQVEHTHDPYTTTVIDEQQSTLQQPVSSVTAEKEATPVLHATPFPQEPKPETHHQDAGPCTCNCSEVATPTRECPTVNTPCNCPDVVPPPCPKVGVADYVPLPGSEAGLMWCIEQCRAYVRDMVLASLPESLAEWIIGNRPMLGVVCVTVAFVSLSVPLMLIMCVNCCSGQGDKKQAHQEKAARVRLEGEKVKLEGERNDLDHRLRESRDTCQCLEDDLRLLRGDMAQLDQDKTQLQAENQRVTEALTVTQQELAQYQTYVEQLNAQLASTTSQLEETTQQRDKGLKKMEELVVELQSQVEGMEAQKEQLEQDKFTTQTALDTLQTQHNQTVQELTELREQYTATDSKLGTVTSDLEVCHVTLQDKEDEVAHLKDCLSQLTDEVAESAVDGETDGREAQLAKIKAMLDTSKAQQELQRVTAERDDHLAQLQQKTSQLEEQIADNESLREQLSQSEDRERTTAQELRELQIKMRGVTEYFQEKESDLHRKIELGEINQQRYKSLESVVQEKVAASEQERERERKELKELRKQMADIEKSFVGQLKSNEERAEDALVQLRRTEQELRQANREVTTLKKKLAEAEAVAVRPPPMARPIPRPHPYPPPPQRTRPPSTGPIGSAPQGPSPQPSRPISAPRLEPRTSSPTNRSLSEALPQDGHMHKSRSYSIPANAGPRPQAELPPRPHSRGSAELAVPPPQGPVRKGPSPRNVSRDHVMGPLPNLEEHPPQRYMVSPHPMDPPLGQRLPLSQAPPTGPPTNFNRGYPPPDGPRRPYQPPRPSYGAPPLSRPPPQPNYHPPGPRGPPRRPGYQVPPRQPMPRPPPMTGQPRPPPMQQGLMPGEPHRLITPVQDRRPGDLHQPPLATPPQTGQPRQQPADSNFGV